MRKRTFNSKNNNFSAFLQIYGVNYNNQGYKRENIQHLNKLEVYLANQILIRNLVRKKKTILLTQLI